MEEKGILLEPVKQRTVVYSMGELGSRDNVLFRYQLADDVYPESFDYVVSFDYVIGQGYSGGFLELTMSTSTIYSTKRYFEDNGYLGIMGDKLAEVDLEGNEGSVEIRLNDFNNFLAVHEHSSVSLSYLPDLGVRYTVSNYIIPLFSVYDGVGNAYTLNHLDSGVDTPATDDGLVNLSGYLKNFKIEARYRED